MDQIPPDKEGAFRISGEENKVTQLGKARHFEGGVSPHNAATALKRSFVNNPPLVDADWNVTGDPKNVDKTLVDKLLQPGS